MGIFDFFNKKEETTDRDRLWEQRQKIQKQEDVSTDRESAWKSIRESVTPTAEASTRDDLWNRTVNTAISQRRNISAKELKTSDGLYRLAVQSGLQKEADDILRIQSGEKTKEIFSGGFISDIFDVVNSLQYGVTGLLKGKSFSEGVRTRQSFTDKDSLGDNGIPGFVAGLALDIAVDPLTYIAPATIARKIPGFTKAFKAGKEAIFGKRVLKEVKETVQDTPGLTKNFETVEGGTRTGKYLASKFTWMFGADPIWRETFERSTKNVAVSTQAIAKMGQAVAKLTPETASTILTRGKFGVPELQDIGKVQKALDPEDFEVVKKFYDDIDKLGKEAVDLKLLEEATWQANRGKYIKRVFEEYELMKTKKGFFEKFRGTGKVGLKGIKTRRDAFGVVYKSKGAAKQLTKKFNTLEESTAFAQQVKKDGGSVIEKFKPLSAAEAAKLGEITNPAYVLAKTTFDLMREVENGKLLRKVSQNWSSKTAQEGFEQIPDTKKWGELAGKYIPTHMKEYLSPVMEPARNTLARQTVANFKFFKVVMNPATHARNIISNKLLNYWKLGMNPLDPRVVKTDAIAVREIFRGGGKWTKEARPLGFDVDNYASQEIPNLLNQPGAAQALGKLGKGWQKTKKALGDIYQGEENHAKLSAYIFNRTHKGLAPEDAWKAAESATFNYAQVTPFVRKLRESLFGFPFITFTVKSTPIAIETALKNPKRISVIGKIKQGIESQSDIQMTDRERASEPPWVKNGFYVKLPMVDKDGRSAYFDMTYILPFGDIVSGNFFESGVDMETGLPEAKVVTALKKSPFFQVIAELGQNQDFYGNKIWRDSDSQEKKLADVMRHLSKVYLPPLASDQIKGGYNYKGEQTQRGIMGASEASDENQKRNLMQELLRNVGAKIQPIDADIQEGYQEWNRKKALETLLRERGIGAEFSSFYVPKNK